MAKFLFLSLVVFSSLLNCQEHRKSLLDTVTPIKDIQAIILEYLNLTWNQKLLVKTDGLMAFSPDNNYCVSTGPFYMSVIQVIHISSGTILKSLKTHSSVIAELAFSPNSAYFASVAFDDSVKIWQTKPVKLLHTLTIATRYAPEHEKNKLAFSPDSRYLIAQDTFKQIYIWLVTTGQLLKNFGSLTDQLLFNKTNYIITHHNISPATNQHTTGKPFFIPNSAKYISALHNCFLDKPIFMPNPEKYISALHNCLLGNPNAVITGARSGDNIHFALVVKDSKHPDARIIEIWNVLQKKLVQQIIIKPLKNFVDRITDLYFSPNGQYLIFRQMCGGYRILKKDTLEITE